MMPASSLVAKPRSGAAMIAASAGVVAILASLTTPGSAQPRQGGTAPASTKLIGNSSCAARGCHGAVAEVRPRGGDVYIKDGSATTWRYYDPHSKAYSVLLTERSKSIARALKDTLEGKPAHESKTCLVCHATVDPLAQNFAGFHLTEGVSCEACHGPAADWLDDHLSPSWREKDRKSSQPLMTDLSNALGRAKTCVGCHVGDRSEGLDVNHDLIAAGHPRLNFEYSTFLASYPKHWREGKGAQGLSAFEKAAASDWAIGQAVTTRAAVDLLGRRAKSSMNDKRDGAASVAPWPEFTEYECYACHHALDKPPWNPDRGPLAVKPGRPPWATWYSEMLPELAKVKAGWDPDAEGSPWPALQAEMKRGVPDTRKVADLADKTVALIDRWLQTGRDLPLDAGRLAGLAKQWAGDAEKPLATWDQAAQRVMAASALLRAAKALKADESPTKEIDGLVKAAMKKLGFPRGFDSPRGGRPGAETGP